MATKEELSAEINSMLDTELDWSRMTKDDLELLKHMIEEGHLLEPLAKKVATDKGKQKFEEIVDGWHPGKYAIGGL